MKSTQWKILIRSLKVSYMDWMSLYKIYAWALGEALAVGSDDTLCFDFTLWLIDSDFISECFIKVFSDLLFSC